MLLNIIPVTHYNVHLTDGTLQLPIVYDSLTQDSNMLMELELLILCYMCEGAQIDMVQMVHNDVNHREYKPYLPFVNALFDVTRQTTCNIQL